MYEPEFNKITEKILNNRKFKKMKNVPHHYATTRYAHNVEVAYKTFKIAKRLNLNYVDMTKAALMHDFYFDEDFSINIDKRRRILNNSPLDTKILTEIINSKKLSTKCAVFCDTIDSCQQLYNNITPKDGVYILHSKIEPDVIDSSIEKFRTNISGVLISPRIFDEGISIEDVSEGFNIAPMLSPLQLVQRMGRILRKHDGKIPKFHHAIGIPSNFLDSDDSIFLHNH